MIKIGSLYRSIFLGFLFFISLVAPYRNPIEIGIVNTSINYIVLLIVLTLAVPLLFYKGSRSASSVYKAFFILIIWALVTTLNKQFLFDDQFILFPLIMTFLILTVAYLFSRLTLFKTVDWVNMVTILSCFLTLVFVLYAYWFAFEFYTTYGVIERLKGPLGGAAVIHLIMFPVLAVHVSNLLRKKNRKISLVFATLTLICIYLTGSRAAIVCLGAFIFLFVVKRASAKKILITLCLTILFVGIAFATMPSESRYEGFLEDSARSSTIEVGIDFWMQNPMTFMFGNGYGTVWPWFIYDTVDSPFPDFGYYNTVYTEFGSMLYHPHSLLLAVGVELGVVGLLIILYIAKIIVKEFRMSLKETDEFRSHLFIGVVSAIPSFLFDLFIFKNWEVSLIWVFFLFVALSSRNKMSE